MTKKSRDRRVICRWIDRKLMEQSYIMNFASRIVANSKDIDPDIHEYVQKNFSKLLSDTCQR